MSGQESDLARFVGNGTKVKIISEIKLPLSKDHKVAPEGLFSGLV